MPSIKQIIAEIQLAQDLGPNQKQFTVRAIRDAEQRLKLKAPSAPRKITNAKGLVTLQAWEAARDKELHYTDLTDWIEKHQLDEFQVRLMIEEFRAEMMAKGKQYANFKMAFQTYVTKGYLSKRIDQLRRKDITVVEKRGLTL